MDNNELKQILENLRRDLVEEEFNDLIDFIDNYLEDENNPRSLMYILDQMSKAGVVGKIGRPINQLLENILSKVDTNALDKATSELAEKEKRSFKEYCEQIIKPVIYDAITDYDDLDSEFYDEDGTSRIRIDD